MKHTHDATDKSNLRLALDAMKVGQPLATVLSFTGGFSPLLSAFWFGSVNKIKMDRGRVFKSEGKAQRDCPLLARRQNRKSVEIFCRFLQENGQKVDLQKKKERKKQIQQRYQRKVFPVKCLTLFWSV